MLIVHLFIACIRKGTNTDFKPQIFSHTNKQTLINNKYHLANVGSSGGAIFTDLTIQTGTDCS